MPKLLFPSYMAVISFFSRISLLEYLWQIDGVEAELKQNLPCMCYRQAFDFVHLFDRYTEVTIVNCDLGRSCDKLNECVHFFLVKGLDNAPEPPNDRRLSRVAFVIGLADEHFN